MANTTTFGGLSATADGYTMRPGLDRYAGQ